MEEIIKGKSTLIEIEKAILGNVDSKSILHLHCHLGQDTISLARMANRVVGVDYSIEAIKRATVLKEKCNLSNIDFICKDIQDLEEKDLNYEKFDIAIASYGILVWIKDFKRWTRAVAEQLKVGGKLILIDEHPFAAIFSGKESLAEFKIEAPYSIDGSPYITRNSYSYANSEIRLKNDVQYKWAHGFEEIFGEVRNSGLEITDFKGKRQTIHTF
ncbi:class I SAM-dependent methyltransferase [Tepidibacillus marianensis]|uniref:class I SAM-dependent methyltransferase n=1 Tax=Tepidibacillus marianensis TaxID=3131995 RepID=UPI0030CF7C7A